MSRQSKIILVLCIVILAVAAWLAYRYFQKAVTGANTGKQNNGPAGTTVTVGANAGKVTTGPVNTGKPVATNSGKIS